MQSERNTFAHFGLLVVERDGKKRAQIHHLHSIPQCIWNCQEIDDWSSLERQFLIKTNLSADQIWYKVRQYHKHLFGKIGKALKEADWCYYWDDLSISNLNIFHSDEDGGGGVDLYRVIVPSIDYHCLISFDTGKMDREWMELFTEEKNFGLVSLEANFPLLHEKQPRKLLAKRDKCVVFDQEPEKSNLRQRALDGKEDIIELTDSCFLLPTKEFLKSPTIYGRAVYVFEYERAINYDQVEEDDAEYIGQKYEMYLHPYKVFLSGGKENDEYFSIPSTDVRRLERLSLLKNGSPVIYELSFRENLVDILHEPGITYTLVHEKRWIL